MAVLKHSRQRDAIKSFLMTRTDHPTADVIYDNVRLVYPNISLGTVYRNLSLLTELGEIKKLPGFAGADHYDGRIDTHCHFFCHKCHQVSDIEISGFQEFLQSVNKQFSGEIQDCDSSFYGICKSCLHHMENDTQK